MIRDIPDDPSVVQPIFEELKRNFYKSNLKDPKIRKFHLKKLLAGYKALKDQISTAANKDLGNSSYFSETLVHPITISEIQDLIDGVEDWSKPVSVPTTLATGVGSCKIQYQPLGVALVLSAWNYPIYTAIPLIAAAMAAGNCVLMKPSQLASYSSGVVKTLFDKYLDPQYFQCIEGKVEVAKAVVKLPVDIICFTGSTATGRLVAIEAAKNLVPCILELGGKCPVIVDETAQVDTAINRILNGKFLNCGQTCIGVDHLYVHESLKQTFKRQLDQKLKIFYEGGQNLQEDGNYGKIINGFHVQRVEKMLKDNHGGKIIYGGIVKKQSRYISPTVIEQPSKDSLMMKEEIFGPILPIFYYSDLKTVVNQIVSRPKPLAVYHFSQSKKNVKFVRENTSSGAYVVNETVMQIANKHLPFGGVGHSGHGRFHGKIGFQSFSNPKSVAELSSMDSWPTNQKYPPYTQPRKNIMRKLIKVGFYTYGQIGKVLSLILVLIIAAVLCGILIPK